MCVCVDHVYCVVLVLGGGVLSCTCGLCMWLVHDEIGVCLDGNATGMGLCGYDVGTACCCYTWGVVCGLAVGRLMSFRGQWLKVRVKEAD